MPPALRAATEATGGGTEHRSRPRGVTAPARRSRCGQYVAEGGSRAASPPSRTIMKAAPACSRSPAIPSKTSRRECRRRRRRRTFPAARNGSAATAKNFPAGCAAAWCIRARCTRGLARLCRVPWRVALVDRASRRLSGWSPVPCSRRRHTNKVIAASCVLLVLGCLQLHFAGRSAAAAFAVAISSISKNCHKNRKAHLIPGLRLCGQCLAAPARLRMVSLHVLRHGHSPASHQTAETQISSGE